MDQEEKNNFLRQFFKENDLFTNEEKKGDSKVIKKNEKLVKNISQKDINLREMFENIEQEKQKNKEKFQKHIASQKQKEMQESQIGFIKKQSEARVLFETFLRILPVIEKEFYLDSVQEIEPRDTRGEQGYIPEIWETNSSVIFFEEKPAFHQPETQEEETETLLQEEPEEIQTAPQPQRIEEKGFEKAQTEPQATKRREESEEIANLIPKTPSKKIEFLRNETKEERTLQAIRRAKKRAAEMQENRRQEGFGEFLKISSMVAGLFFMSMVGLNFSAIIEWSGAERYLNASAFKEQQDSISELISEDNKKTKEIDRKNDSQILQMLPVAGEEYSEKEEDFDMSMYLNIAPPDTRIIIPKIGKNIPIVQISDDSRREEDWERLEEDIQIGLQDGVVHYPGTAEPGQFGNAFITGHSSYYPWDNGRYKDVFAALHDLEVGDEYYIFHKGKKYQYIIRERKVVKPSDVSVLEQDTTKRTSTLMTCTPIGTTARRLILQAEQLTKD